MRVSNFFGLKKTQAELDFIDIDLEKDVSLFIDPHFLANRTDSWSVNSTRTIKSFFQYIITLLSSQKIEEARKIFSYLHEPNETCLGLSKHKPSGRGVGPQDTSKIFNSILKSKAVKSGLVEDLEDCVIFVENFGKDKLSDMTTNIIRKHLIDYTLTQCELWNITLSKNIQSGYYWNRTNNQWETILTKMLVIQEKRYLLVPKSIVSYSSEYTAQNFHTHFALNFLQGEHLRLNTALVQKSQRKDGSIRTFVAKKSIKERESPGTKEDINNFVEKYPNIFKNFKHAKRSSSKSLSNEEICKIDIIPIDLHLKENLIKILPGPKFAAEYHNHIVGIMELLFYPELTCPQKEEPIHDGRKRIDITFDNSAQKGIFYDLYNQISCQYIFVECKNYSADPKNPELDQLSGRFSPSRGKVGLLVCRTIDDINTFYARCSDTYKDDRGLILPIVDNDIIEGLDNLINGNKCHFSESLRDRRRKIQIK